MAREVSQRVKGLENDQGVLWGEVRALRDRITRGWGATLKVILRPPGNVSIADSRYVAPETSGQANLGTVDLPFGVVYANSFVGGGDVVVPQATVQNQMIIADATPAWALLAAPSAQGQVLITGVDPYTPAWAALTVGAISDLAYATPALTLSTVNAAGAADTVIRSDATILVFDATVPNTIQPDDAAAVGAVAVAARRDHEHAIVCAAPASPSVNLSVSGEGSGTSFARADHAHQLDQAIAPTWTSQHSFTGGARFVRAAAATVSLSAYVTADSFSRFYVTAGGELYFGSGAGSADVKLYRSAANALRLEDKFIVDVGITLNGATGTNVITVPDNVAQAVHLVDAGGIEYLRVVSTDAQPAVVFNEGGADVDFRVEASGQANALFVQGSDGHIGKNTSDPATDFHIVGTAVANKHYSAHRTQVLEDDNVVLQLIGTDASTSMCHIVLTGAPGSGDDKHWIMSHLGPDANNRFSIGHMTSSADNFVQSVYSEYFVILPVNGYVGLGGMVTPTALVHLGGEGVGSGIKLTRGTLISQWFGAFDGPAFFGCESNDDLHIRTNATNRVTILAAGYVGVNASPAYRLDVLDNRASNFVANIKNDGNDVNRYGINVQAGGTGAAAGTTFFFYASDGAGAATGNLKTVDGVFQIADTSDERRKTNIEDTKVNGLSIINQLKVRDFNWKVNPDGPVMTSFVAQEAQEVYPAMVGEALDGTLMTSRGILIPVLVKAIQELDARLTQLAVKGEL